MNIHPFGVPAGTDPIQLSSSSSLLASLRLRGASRHYRVIMFSTLVFNSEDLARMILEMAYAPSPSAKHPGEFNLRAGAKWFFELSQVSKLFQRIIWKTSVLQVQLIKEIYQFVKKAYLKYPERARRYEADASLLIRQIIPMPISQITTSDCLPKGFFAACPVPRGQIVMPDSGEQVLYTISEYDIVDRPQPLLDGVIAMFNPIKYRDEEGILYYCLSDLRYYSVEHLLLPRDFFYIPPRKVMIHRVDSSPKNSYTKSHSSIITSIYTPNQLEDCKARQVKRDLNHLFVLYSQQLSLQKIAAILKHFNDLLDRDVANEKAAEESSSKCHCVIA